MALASTAILGSEDHGIHDYISLSDGSGTLQTTEVSSLKARLPRSCSLYGLGMDRIQNIVSHSSSIAADTCSSAVAGSAVLASSHNVTISTLFLFSSLKQARGFPHGRSREHLWIHSLLTARFLSYVMILATLQVM
jgi:hypothetical protein